jgi:hypothetical protein
MSEAPPFETTPLSVVAQRSIRKLQPPKSRRRCQKLNSNPLPIVPGFAQKHHAALLLIIRVRIRQYDHLALIDFVLQQQQSAVRIDHQRLAHFAKFSSIVAAAGRLDSHLVKHAPAAAWRGKSSVRHAPIFNCMRNAGQLPDSTGVPLKAHSPSRTSKPNHTPQAARVSLDQSCCSALLSAPNRSRHSQSLRNPSLTFDIKCFLYLSKNVFDYLCRYPDPP